MSDRSTPERLLVVAGHPFQLSDLGPEVAARYDMKLVRRAEDVGRLLDELDPDIALVDTSLREGQGFSIMEELESHQPQIPVVALTPDPPPHDHVALSARSGAGGFVDVDASAEQFAAALASVRRGESWYPADKVRGLLADVADDLDTTTAERRSRLTGIVLALVPITGIIAMIQAGLWRRYLGLIGVRPIDLAVDPASRVLDAIVSLMLIIGIVGPLLFVRNWLDMLARSRLNRGVLARFLARRTLAQVVASILWLLIAAVMAIGPDVGLVFFVGPVVTLAILAKTLDADDELPRALRIRDVSTRAVMSGTALVLVLFVGVLVYETEVVGPDLRNDGVHGWIAPRVLGVGAQPVEATNVNTDEVREVLYLGGNADLYVLVDPCRDGLVDMVSVGAHRLVIIDEIMCASGSG
jgi:DNA-binding NarL/FixJ family response regulator